MATIAATLPIYRELSPSQRVLRRLLRRRGAMLGLAVVIAFIALALFAPWISPYDPLQTSWSAVRKAPTASHWFGTDEIGRDVLSRVIWGARASLLAGLVSVCISLALGVPIGLLAGYVGRGVDSLISRITDAMLACPLHGLVPRGAKGLCFRAGKATPLTVERRQTKGTDFYVAQIHRGLHGTYVVLLKF